MKPYLAFFLLSATAYLGQAQTPVITSGGVLNGAGFQVGQQITPGSLISIFGTNLASTTAAADTIPLSTKLGGVTVQFVSGSTTVNAPLTFVQPDSASSNSQINAQVPWEIIQAGTTATVSVIVSNNGVQSQPAMVTVGPFSPGVFSSGGRAIAINQDGTLSWPVGAVAGLTTRPAKAGDTITIYATGLGALDSPIADGANSLDKTRNTLTTPIVMIGGITANVLFSGLSPQFVGVNQLNVTVPSVAAGDALPIQIQIGGMTTPNNITIAVGQ
jgi:uncharacterized protein (TIGR03437 family)